MEPVNINNFLGSKHLELIYIPRFQRKYAWDKFQINQFLEDFKKILDSNESHFFGLIVYVPKKNLDQSSKGVDIIDGQQRLTTLIIFLSVIKDMLWDIANNYKDELSTEDSSDINTTFTNILNILKESTTTLGNNNISACRLITENEEKYEKDFLNIIQKSMKCFKNKTDEPRKSYEQMPNKSTLNIKENYMLGKGHKNVTKSKNSLKNYKIIWEWIKKDMTAVSANDGLKQYNRLKTYCIAILNHIEIIPFKVENYQKAFEYFEVLNDRGLDVSALDLIKNQLLQKGSQPSARAEIFENWKKIFVDTLKGVSNKTQFVRYSYMSTKGHISKKEIFTSYKTYFESSNFKVSDFLEKDLLLHAEIYSDFNESEIKLKEKGGHHNIGNAIELLKSTKTVQWYSIAISVLEPFYILQDDPVYKEELRAKAINLLKIVHEIMMSINFIGAASANDIEKPFPNDFAIKLNYEKDNSNIQQALSKFEEEIDAMTQSLKNFTEQQGWGWNKILDILTDKNNFISLFKDRNSMAYMITYLVYYQTSNITQHQLGQWTLEHVFPQTPKPNDWPIIQNLSSNEIDEFCYSFGNFLITSPSWNSKHKNKSWDVKKIEYVSSSLNEFLSNPYGWKNCNDWTPDYVKERESKITEILNKYYDDLYSLV